MAEPGGQRSVVELHERGDAGRARGTAPLIRPESVDGPPTFGGRPLVRSVPLTVRRHRLANGLTVLVRRDPSAPVVAIVTFVSAGYFDETDDVVGIAHVLEHMFFKGTPNRGVGEIAKQTKALGGYLNAGTIYDHTSYYTVLPSSAFEKGLEIQADAYARSLIDDEELRRELEVIIEEAKRKADNPGAVATETLYELLHDRHRIRRWRIGREEGLRTLTADSVRKFYRAFYHPENTVLAIVGDVDPDRAIAEAESLYGALPRGSVERSRGEHEDGPAGFRYRELSGDILQTQIAIGWRAPATLHRDAPALDLLASVLSAGRASRLFRAVRDRSLASSVSAYHYTPTDLGVFVVTAESKPETARSALTAIWDQLRRVREGEISEHEVERAKRIYESRWIRQLEDMEGQANFLASWEALGDWMTGDRYLDSIMRLTAKDLSVAARDWLPTSDAAVLVYRPASSPPFAADGDEMRSLLSVGGVAAVEASSPIPAAAPISPVRVRIIREEAGVRVYQGPGGVPILVRLKPDTPLAHVGLFVAGGAIGEPADRAGLTLLMARTAARASERRSTLRVAEEAELLGGSIGASVAGDSFGWALSVPAKNLAAATELLADVLQHPAFPPEVLETERAAAIAAVIATRDDMYRYPLRLATSAAYAGHPYGTPAAGTEQSLAAVTRADVIDWHRDRVRAGSTVIAVVADGNADDIAALVAGAFTGLRRVEASPPSTPGWTGAPLEVVESRDRAQSAIAMLYPGPGRLDRDRFAASLIGGIASGLGGRFFDELREKRSLCYTVHTFLSERWKAGAFVAYIATSPDREGEARQGLLDEFRKIREGGVTPDELARAQTYAIGVHQIRMQSGGAVLGEIADAFMFGSLAELDEVDANVRAVTLEDIRAVAVKYFDPERRVEGIVRGRSS
ncbi:MAG TPA: pitrilysin family protein [Gemmatimonadaceae bacterium]|nr:pitrilysin family protein [Gemmatimonadaceae bacterium]